MEKNNLKTILSFVEKVNDLGIHAYQVRFYEEFADIYIDNWKFTSEEVAELCSISGFVLRPANLGGTPHIEIRIFYGV